MKITNEIIFNELTSLKQEMNQRFESVENRLFRLENKFDELSNKFEVSEIRNESFHSNFIGDSVTKENLKNFSKHNKLKYIL